MNAEEKKYFENQGRKNQKSDPANFVLNNFKAVNMRVLGVFD